MSLIKEEGKNLLPVIIWRAVFMVKILDFPQNVTTNNSTQLDEMKNISDAIDHIIMSSLHEKGIKPNEILGLIAHRMGAILRHCDKKEELWKVCEKILKKQALIETSTRSGQDA